MNRKTAKPQAAANQDRHPVPHSYLRFSSDKQEWGDSTSRQVADSEGWSERSGIPLSSKLEAKGAGAFRGKDRDGRSVLGHFLKLAQQGDGHVGPGDYLVIENLDRLSR